MIGNIVVNKKGEPQLDKYGQELYIGQPVIIMGTCSYAGSRGSFSTGVIVGFDRFIIALKDGKDLVPDSQVLEHAKFLEEKNDKKRKTWVSDLAEEKSRGLELWPEKVTSQFLIGCTEKVRRGFRDGSLFKV